MPLADAYRATRSIEALENYARADEIAEPTNDAPEPQDGLSIVEDREFWYRILGANRQAWGMRVEGWRFALSEWIARVPGLYWTANAEALRQLSPEQIELKDERRTLYRPPGKSQLVSGGMGTLKLPPNERGYRLISLSGALNASTGIPALVAPEVWDAHGLREGDVLDVQARWQPMVREWAEQFESIKGIPRGYLMLDRPEYITNVAERDAPTRIHPFTIMEYSFGAARLYDFVYAAADTSRPRYRAALEEFFDEYRARSGRAGEYLIDTSIGEPLWEARFASPAALRQQAPGVADAQLNLIKERVREQVFRGETLEELVEMLARLYDNDGLQRISDQIGIPPAHWYSGRRAADSAVQLLDACVARRAVEQLIERVAIEYPREFQIGV